MNRDSHVTSIPIVRFLATEESYAHPIYKKKLIEFDRTEFTNIFGRARWPNAPHRVLETVFFREYGRSLPDHENEANKPIIGRSVIHGQVKESSRSFPLSNSFFTLESF